MPTLAISPETASRICEASGADNVHDGIDELIRSTQEHNTALLNYWQASQASRQIHSMPALFAGLSVGIIIGLIAGILIG